MEADMYSPCGKYPEGGDTYNSLSKSPDVLFAKLFAKLQNYLFVNLLILQFSAAAGD